MSCYNEIVTGQYEIRETAQEYGSDKISELVDFLSLELDDYNLTKDKKVIEDRLMCIAETKQMIEIADNSLKHLKTHPKNGQVYHDIITYCYIDKDVMLSIYMDISTRISYPLTLVVEFLMLVWICLILNRLVLIKLLN